jgi:Xaa-Pro aminopeptidase
LVVSAVSNTSARFAALRARLAEAGGDGVIVPLTDEHMSEYVGDYARRLEWLTGFTGSAGTAIVLRDRAALFVDGRYGVQARAETDALLEVCVAPGVRPADWLVEHAPPGATVLYDPWLHTAPTVAALQGSMKNGTTLRPSSGNLVDAIWFERPAPSPATAEVHAATFTGRSSAEKRRLIADALVGRGADAVVISALDSVAWTLNIRGRDVPHTPVVQAFLLLTADAGGTLFVDPAKIGSQVRAHLGPEIEVRPYGDILAALTACGGRRVLVDPDTCVVALREALAGAEVLEGPDPCVWPRAIKTPVELEGARAAHVREGAALCRFLQWVQSEGLDGGVDELEAAEVLEAFRRPANRYREPSFTTISAVGANGALPHYTPKPGRAARLTPGTLYLVDAGAQYEDGTTDATRTVALGTPTDAMRRHFTLALKGHLAVAMLTVPKGTTGGQLDPLARQHLWAAGLDYNTGTGHGVGTCLSVHEGPVFIGRRGGTRPVDEPLVADLLLTVEPGLYLEGRYGVRTENVYRVASRTGEEGDDGWLGFEPLTLAPIDRALIDLALLTPAERAWIDGYHAQVLTTLARQVPESTRAWLEAACAPL